jgi:hypothetical protein
MGLPLDKLLSENLGRMFEARGITSAAKAEEALRVPKSTIDRAWHCRSMARLDTLDDVAKGLKVAAWQLLVPGLDPHHLPAIEGVVSTSVKKKSGRSSTHQAESSMSEADFEDKIVELVALFVQSTPEARDFLLASARNADKAASARWVRVGDDA